MHLTWVSRFAMVPFLGFVFTRKPKEADQF